MMFQAATLPASFSRTILLDCWPNDPVSPCWYYIPGSSPVSTINGFLFDDDLSILGLEFVSQQGTSCCMGRSIGYKQSLHMNMDCGETPTTLRYRKSETGKSISLQVIYTRSLVLFLWLTLADCHKSRQGQYFWRWFRGKLVQYTMAFGTFLCKYALSSSICYIRWI